MSETPDIQTGQDAAREAVKWATRAERSAQESAPSAKATGMAHMWAHVSQALTAATPPLLGSDVPGRCSVTSESGQQCMLNEEHSGLCIPAPERTVQRAWEADADADAEELEQKRAFRPDRCPTVSESGQQCMFNEDHWSPCIPVPKESFLHIARIGVGLPHGEEEKSTCSCFVINDGGVHAATCATRAGALPMWEADAEGRLDRLTLLTSRMARGVLDEEEHDELRSLIEELQTKVEVLLQGQCVHNKSKHDLAHLETVDLCVWCKLKAEGETDG